MTDLKQKYDIEIFFKSGNSLRVRAYEVGVEKRGGAALAALNYKLVDDQLMFIDLNQVECVINHGLI